MGQSEDISERQAVGLALKESESFSVGRQISLQTEVYLKSVEIGIQVKYGRQIIDFQ